VAINPTLWQWILAGSRRYNLDPRAVAAISYHESGGRFGAVGDGGTSYGPFQLHRGGALPPGKTAAWANSRAGVDYALRQMGSVAGGLQGRAAVAAISRRFERPQNPGAEISDAWAHYQGVSPGGGFGDGLPHLRQQRFIHQLRSALGTPYVWGGTSLQNGVDCSGLVQAAGIKGVPRTSQQQFHVGSPVKLSGLRPGDLVFSNWGNEQGAGHVSVYIGNGKIIEAAGSGIPVRVASMSVLQGHILGARRILANPGQTVPNASHFAQQQEHFYAQNAAAAVAGLNASIRPIQLPQLPTASPAQTLAKIQLAHQPATNPGLDALKQQAQPPTTPLATQPDYAGQLATLRRKLVTGA
jgi:hypothetical protein